MKTINSPNHVDKDTLASNLKNPKLLKVIQILSQLATAIFLAALFWAIYQAFINGNPLPVWAWLGVVVLLAVVIGLGVAFVVYRGVRTQTGPFDFRPSSPITGELKNESRLVETGGARLLVAEINMIAGALHLTGGGTDVLDARFTYDDAAWKQPTVTYAVDDAGQGNLAVKQQATHRPAMHQGRCEWDIRLHRDLPLELDVKFGAGRAELRLADLMLTRLRIDSGVGELTLDLSGEWNCSLDAFIKAGIGDTHLRLPKNAGVRIQSMVGLGSIHAAGLVWDGQAYANALYGQADANLDITIEGGIGKIDLD